jgi:hypothetical protein
MRPGYELVREQLFIRRELKERVFWLVKIRWCVAGLPFIAMLVIRSLGLDVALFPIVLLGMGVLACNGVFLGVARWLERRRYVIAYNPQQAEFDRINREQILDRLSCELEVLNRKNKTKALCKLILHRSMGRYVKELKSGKLK